MYKYVPDEQQLLVMFRANKKFNWIELANVIGTDRRKENKDT